MTRRERHKNVLDGFFVFVFTGHDNILKGTPSLDSATPAVVTFRHRAILRSLIGAVH